MARARQPDDWERDLERARPVEQQVAQALRVHHRVRRFVDDTESMDLDFRFHLDGQAVALDVKEKHQRLSAEYCSLWPDVPERDLFIIDERAYRALVWDEGLGYLLVHDRPVGRWCVFGPWELTLGPRRRFERAGDRGSGSFLKGKLLIDLRSAAAVTPVLDADRILRVVRQSRGALGAVAALTVGSDPLAVVPAGHALARGRGRGRPASTPAGARPDAPPEPSHPVPAAPTGTAADADSAVESAAAATDDDWAGLDAGLVAAVRRSWGWRAPTAVQQLAWPAVLAGDTTLILAPTAGGKTEAALLPLLDIWRREDWKAAAPSIIAVSPLKALLDDQLRRWQRAGALVGARVFAWHGDVDRGEKDTFRVDPADALLTTPESLELMLSGPAYQGDVRQRFGSVRAVVVDEVHAFAGTARGAQLAALLERLDGLATHDIQRIGLSATVGQPERVLEWLRGGSQRAARVVAGPPATKHEQLEVVTYGSDVEAVAVVSAAVGEERALVFTRSRRRAELLGHGLGVPVHHSAVAGGRRDEALRQLEEGTARCVVATSSLEMGIDVAGLDLVVHDGAPTGPGSFLQRLGRAGRQTGLRRLTFALGDVDELLLTLAVVARARRGDLEPSEPQRGARLVLGQQALALAFQLFLADRGALRDALRWSPVFRGLDAEIDATLDHLIASGWLWSDGSRLTIGPRGQQRFGNRFADLLATFAATGGAQVVTETGEAVGTADWAQVADGAEPRQGGLVLSGRPWQVVRVDRAAAVAVVVPAAHGRPLSWRGAALEVDRATWETVREVVAGTEVPLVLDARAERWLAGARAGWAPRLARPVRGEAGGVVVDGFAGVAVHRAVLNALGLPGSPGGASLTIDANPAVVALAARRALARLDDVVAQEARAIALQLPVRHADLLPAEVLVAEARAFHVDSVGMARVLTTMVETTWPS